MPSSWHRAFLDRLGLCSRLWPASLREESSPESIFARSGSRRAQRAPTPWSSSRLLAAPLGSLLGHAKGKHAMEIRSSVALALLSLAAATARQGPACSRSRCPGAVAAAGPAGAPRGASFRGRSPADRGLIPGASRGERARLLQGTLRLRGGQTVDKSARDKDEESRGKEARRKRKQSSGGGAGRAADNEGASDAGAAVGSRDSTSAVPAQGHGTVAGKGEPPGQEEEEAAAVGGAGGSGPRLMFGVSCYAASPKQRRLTHTHTIAWLTGGVTRHREMWAATFPTKLDWMSCIARPPFSQTSWRRVPRTSTSPAETARATARSRWLPVTSRGHARIRTQSKSAMCTCSRQRLCEQCLLPRLVSASNACWCGLARE